MKNDGMIMKYVKENKGLTGNQLSAKFIKELEQKSNEKI